MQAAFERQRAAHVRFISLGACLVMLASLTSIVSGSPAWADTVLCSGSSYSVCVNAGYTDHGYGAHSGTSYWGAFTGHNCTNYVAYVETVDGVVKPSYHLGDAWQWWSEASGHVPENGKPAVGAVAWWGQNQGGVGSDGHVAYVEAVNTNGSITVSEDAYPSGPFDWMVITPGSGRWPGGFIHFKDLQNASGGGTIISTEPQSGGGVDYMQGVWQSGSTWSWSFTNLQKWEVPDHVVSTTIGGKPAIIATEPQSGGGVDYMQGVWQSGSTWSWSFTNLQHFAVPDQVVGT